ATQGASYECKALAQHLHIHAQGVICLQCLDAAVRMGEWMPGRLEAKMSSSLACLAERYLAQKLVKSPARLSQWDSWPLSAEQVEYAATDAFASYCVYREMEKAGHVNQLQLWVSAAAERLQQFNSCSFAELRSIEGIGKGTADAIIQHRPYADLADARLKLLQWIEVKATQENSLARLKSGSHNIRKATTSPGECSC
ncbi:unnamed protein product, partial [Polarella glacialis]